MARWVSGCDQTPERLSVKLRRRGGVTKVGEAETDLGEPECLRSHRRHHLCLTQRAIEQQFRGCDFVGQTEVSGSFCRDHISEKRMAMRLDARCETKDLHGDGRKRHADAQFRNSDRPTAHDPIISGGRKEASAGDGVPVDRRHERPRNRRRRIPVSSRAGERIERRNQRHLRQLSGDRHPRRKSIRRR